MNQYQILEKAASHLESAAQLLRSLTTEAGHEDDTHPAGDKSVRLPDDDWIQLARDLHPALGERQEQVLREVAKAHPEGTGTGPIWRAIGYEQTNTYLTLDALGRHGLVRKDDQSKPHRYYLGPRLLQRAAAT